MRGAVMGGEFTEADLALIERDPTDAEIEAEVDAEDAATNAAMLKYGLSPEEVARIRGTTEEEVLRPAPTLRSVEKELAELKELRKSSPRDYWSDAVQAREAELIEARERLQGDGEGEAEEDDAEQDAESINTDLPEELQTRWNENGGLAKNIAAARSRVILAFGDALEAEDTQSLFESFDRLDDDIRVEVADQLAQDHGGGWPSAKPAEVEQFQATEWGGELSEVWGSRTPKMLGAARREADAILARLGERQRGMMNNWVNAKSAAQKRRMVELLAARAVRRL
jgi:hypothetical protein